MSGIEKRQHPRFESSELPEIRVSTVNGPIGEKLMTVSIGGCGFWSPLGDFRFEVGDRVRMTALIEDFFEGAEELRGEVIYIHPHPVEGQIGRYYGIRFIAENVNVANFRQALLSMLEGKKKKAGLGA